MAAVKFDNNHRCRSENFGAYACFKKTVGRIISISQCLINFPLVINLHKTKNFIIRNGKSKDSSTILLLNVGSSETLMRN